MMDILLYIALGYLLLTTIILLLNKSDFQPLPEVGAQYLKRQAPSVSICIPARNEEQNIKKCLNAAIKQNYPNVHTYVLDDRSEDQTAKIIEALAHEYPDQITAISGQPKPNDWLGKPWACQQLADASEGDILLFADADTWMEPNTVTKTIRTMGRDVLDLLTLWPNQQLKSFWEKMVIPLIYQALFTHLPVRYVHHPPKWLPPFLRKPLAPLFTAACGQFMTFKRTAYDNIGGHHSVKNRVLDDVALAREIKRSGFTMNMYNGQNSVKCRMYRSHSELWHGLRKNFFAGFGFNLSFFVFTGFLHFISYIFPILLLPFLSWSFPLTWTLMLAILATLLIYFQRFYINSWFHWNRFFALFHPLGIAWYQLLGLQVMKDFSSAEGAYWKGREL